MDKKLGVPLTALEDIAADALWRECKKVIAMLWRADDQVRKKMAKRRS